MTGRTNDFNFKSKRGVLMTNGLFLEMSYMDTKDAVFTLKADDYEHEGKMYVSLQKRYLSYDHVPGSEYEFANIELGGWKHWVKLQANEMFKPYIKEWQDEMEVKMRAKGVVNIMKCASEKNFQAAKWLADAGYKAPRKAGRPTKEVVEKDKKTVEKVRRHLTDFSERINEYGS